MNALRPSLELPFVDLMCRQIVKLLVYENRMGILIENSETRGKQFGKAMEEGMPIERDFVQYCAELLEVEKVWAWCRSGRVAGSLIR
jgi:hypothetical protein